MHHLRTNLMIISIGENSRAINRKPPGAILPIYLMISFGLVSLIVACAIIPIGTSPKFFLAILHASYIFCNEHPALLQL